MKPKFKVGDLARTIKGAAFDIEGTITDIIYPSKDIVSLWGEKEIRYELRDLLSGESVQVVERQIETFKLANRRRRKIPNRWQ